MPRLAFEEPKGGPLAKAARQARQAEQAEEELTAQLLDQPGDELDDQFDDQPDEQGGAGRHRQDGNRDTVLLIMKVATIAVAIALVGAVVLLATTGGDESAGRSPAVPDIESSDQANPAPSSESPMAGIVMPEVRSQTGQFSPSVPPPVTQPTSLPSPEPGPGQNQFVRAGDPCDTPGAYAFTERFEPVVCEARGPGGQLAWRRLFR